jgi:hypothetical protein
MPGVRAFGRVNRGAIFEAYNLLDKGSVPLLSIFYSDKAHLKGWGHHPINREWGTNYFFVFLENLLIVNKKSPAT